MKVQLKREKKYRRHKRVKAKISGTKERPRLCVFKSSKHIYAQLINDEQGKTLVAADDLKIKKEKSSPLKSGATEDKEEKRTGKIAIAYRVGKLIAKKALEEKIERVIFDRGGYKYHGRVKALAEGAREGGLKF